jgi:Holliday junction resolvase-like predicted endonuclease
MISRLGTGPEDGRGADPEREERLKRLIAADSNWTLPDRPLADPPWTPDLVSQDGAKVLHLQTDQVPLPYMQKRLTRAVELGLAVHIACSLNALYNERLLRALSQIDPVIHLDDEENGAVPVKRLLLTLALQDIQLGLETRKVLASDGLARALESSATNHEKGQRFEAVVAFLFSQADGFRVSATNYRTATEEIDIVLRQLSAQGRIWSREGPLVLVEARNRAEGISQEMFSAFRTKIQVKRGRAKLGFMVSSTSVSGEAERQEEKTALGDIAVVFLNGDELAKWIATEDHNAWLERQVEARILE